MNKTEIFAKIISVVSIETEVSESRILSDCKSTEVVDARSILVKILQETGLYPVQIAGMLHKTPACIRNILSNYDIRESTNKLMKIYRQHISKKLESIPY